MTGIYERYGLRTLINARGTHTRLGGSIMEPEVLDAMREASRSYILLEELQQKASELIARATGAEAGIITGGAAAALIQGAAACIAGSDSANIERLPDTTGMKNEVVVHRAHRNGYDHSVRATGAKMVEIGYSHRTIPYQLEAAFSDQTAMVLYLMSPWASRGAMSLAATCEVAHRHGVPVMVDAAATLPPASNLRRFIDDGADLVVFSGGKGIRGPQSSGILAGRAELVRAAWLNGSPNHSIGRPGKASKEDIVGLMVALERYLQRDHEADLAHWRRQAEYIANAVDGIPGLTVSILHDGREHITPRVEVVFDAGSSIDAHELVVALENGDPRVYLFEPDGPSARQNSIIVNCGTTQPGDELIIADVLRAAILDRKAAPAAAERTMV